MRLEAPRPEETSPKLRERIEAMRLSGDDTRAIEAMSNAPHIQNFYIRHFYKEVFFSGIAPIRTKELVRLKLSMLHGCAM